MAGVSIEAIKELRERTHAGMTDCKNALAEADSDIDKAVEIILKKGLAKSVKRAGAIATEGEVRASVAPDGRSAVMVEVNVQTDFAARNELFQGFVAATLRLAERTPADAELSTRPLDGKTIADQAVEVGAKLGEKVALRRWVRLDVPEGKHGLCHAYVHLGGKIGVVVLIETDTPATSEHADVRKFADETAMQIAAMSPVALRREQIGEAERSARREIFEAQLRDDPKPKPEQAWPKIIEGKLNKWFSEVVLLEQESVVVPGNKIQTLAEIAGRAAGGAVAVTRFVRFERGEGIEQHNRSLTEDLQGMLS